MAATSDSEPLIGRKLISDEPPEIRAGFIAKVYGILSVQLMLTAAIAAPFVLSDSVKAFVKMHGFPLVIFAVVLNLCFLFAMMCPCGCERNLRIFPINYLLLGGFTVTEGLLVGVCCAQYSVASVGLSVACTAVLVAGLTAYAMYTKTDFTGLGPYLFAGCMVLFFFGFFLMFVQSPLLHKVMCCLGILVFSFYLIYDTQLIVGGGQCELGVDDYAYGALQLYIDIIQLFLYILQLFGDRE
mmetsp:Transcript_135582/g.377592  ORF Transcript_135582/g.377592 Transcript_135582/m.377592 type:complete len:241 (+) Transcript_135582:80-802(+)